MDYILHIIIMISITIPLVLGLTLIFGKGKIFHFGPLGASLAAAYGLYATLYHTGNVPLSLGTGLILAVVVSAIFAELSLRLPGDSFGILSLAVYLMLLVVVNNWTGFTRGTLGIPFIERFWFMHGQLSFALVAAGLAAVWIIIYIIVDRSWLGRAMAALGEQRAYAEAMGVSRRVCTHAAFALIALATFNDNFLYPQYLGLLTPGDYVFSTFVFSLMCALAGKPGSIWGSVLASTLLTILKEGLRFVSFVPSSMLGPVRLLLFGVILIVVLWVRRDQMFPRTRTV